MFSPENAIIVEQAQVIKNMEGSNETIVIGKMVETPPGVIVHSMLFKGLWIRGIRGQVFSWLTIKLFYNFSTRFLSLLSLEIFILILSITLLTELYLPIANCVEIWFNLSPRKRRVI